MKRLAGSIAHHNGVRPSDVLDPYLEDVWGIERLYLDVACNNEYIKYSSTPETTKDKVSRMYEQYDEQREANRGYG